MQRRHQKVVEVAPAVSLDPTHPRTPSPKPPSSIAREAGYYNAGTVEFLVDADTGEFFFIEVNPRIQVEHTVTEMVTGIDLVRSQILVAQGRSLHDAPLSLPQQDNVPLYGYALQCRITTEDPANNFTPDYGKHPHLPLARRFRHPPRWRLGLRRRHHHALLRFAAGQGHRLRRAISTRPATAWTAPSASSASAASTPTSRSSKTSSTTPLSRPAKSPPRSSTRIPSSSSYAPRKDRATKLLTYLGEVIVNGNPEVAGKPRPLRFQPAPVPPRIPATPPPGTRQMLDRTRPRRIRRVDARAEAPAAHRHHFPRRPPVPAGHAHAHLRLIAAIANFVAHRLSGLYSLEMWGGATFDVTMRFLLEDPWQRLRRLREAIPNICFQMLLRASNAVGYTAYPDNVVREFIAEAAAQGIDIFRIFDSLNWLPNMKVAMEAVRKTGGVCEAAICYTGDILDPARQKYSLDYYVRMAKELERMGAHILGIKDMAGLLKPYAAETLVKALRDEVGIPIHFHTHDTSGINAASILKASDAGVDVADGAIASMSGPTSQPNLNSIVAALAHTKRDTGLDLDALNQCADYWETVRTYYRPFDTGPKTGTAEVYLHEMPGGQITNLKEQAEAMGLGDRWPEIAKTYAEVNFAFGDIVKVTPSSKVVGDLAIFLVTHGMTVAEFEKLGPDHRSPIPNSVVDMFEGSLGVPEGGWPPKMQADGPSRQEAGARPSRRAPAPGGFRRNRAPTGNRDRTRAHAR